MIKKIFYKGKEINKKDLEIIWTDHFGEGFNGSIEQWCFSEIQDAIEEEDGTF